MLKVILDHPIETPDGVITEVMLQRPKAKHVKEAFGSAAITGNGAHLEFGQMMELARVCSDLPPGAFDLLDYQDVIKLVGHIAEFLGN